MPRFGTTELIVIAIIILVLFGGKKIPELVKGIASAIKEFRNAFKEKE
jgi:sec-independent protein translocase protein TatA